MRTRDIVIVVIVIALLFLTYIPVEEAEKKGGAAFGTMNKTGKEILGKPAPETPVPETAE